jgi:hypothetical protein
MRTMSMHFSKEDCIQANKERLKTILDSMDIPDKRKDMSFESLQWLIRNISFRNLGHSDFEEALYIIKMLRREFEKTDINQ